jgi:hypothetical protein
MDSRGRAAFALLIAAQAAHSIEEYVFRLFDVFGPARFVSGLVSSNLAAGFAVVNAGIVLVGVWCYAARIRPGHPSARSIAWFLAVLEFANGTSHTMLAVSRGGYFPGAYTAPFLIGISLYLASRLVAAAQRT